MTSILATKPTRYQKREKKQPKPVNCILRPNSNVKKKILVKNHGRELKKEQKICETEKIPVKLENKIDIANKASTNQVRKSVEISGNKKKLSLKEVVLNKEYYPQHTKRKGSVKKVILQAKHDYKVVATTNKRKRRMPLKGVKAPSPPGLSLRSLVAAAEARGLDDDDFAEILTCPSPVWWEDSDDDFSFSENEEATLEEKSKTNEHKQNFFKEFVAKRSKLETVLGNIKVKKINPIMEQNTITEFKNNIKIENNKINRGEVKIVAQNGINIENNGCGNKLDRIRQNSLGNISGISEEELLKTLENIEIPIRDVHQDINNDIIMSAIKTEHETVSKPFNRSNRNRRYKNKKCNKINNEVVSSIKMEETNFNLDKFSTNNDRFELNRIKDEYDDIKIDVPTDLPPLTKNPFKSNFITDSPKSTESLKEFNGEPDSISDTNIKFLDEYIDDRQTDRETVNVKQYDKNEDGELVTVYQIINNDDLDFEKQIKVNLVNKSPQIVSNNNKNSEINLFFKTRKSAYRCRSKYKKL